MTQAKILLADNDLDFLETRREFLDKDGYAVSTASSPTEVRRVLEQEDVDLAIVDIRLVNDDDEKDISGLEVAKSLGRSLPVIILTGYPAYEYARQALRFQVDGIRVAQDFVSKEEGPTALLTAVRRALEIAQSQKVALTMPAEEEAEKPAIFKRWRPFAAIVALLLALGAGIVAMIMGDPSWLIGTVALAILAVFFVGISTK